MRRGQSGRFEVSDSSGEQVRAFVPSPLPPKPALDLAGGLQRHLEAAGLALGRLDGAATLLPDKALFVYAYVRKEAVLSSQIEGTQSTLSDLLLFELDGAPGATYDDVIDVSNYVAALEHGLARLRSGFPLSSRLIREVHAVLMARGRGSGKDPGEFRRSQNWIGGSRPGNAAFVPPPPSHVEECMGALERFVNDGGASTTTSARHPSNLPVLVRAGLAHLQFESIHPFLDGNGRVGRLLITLLLCQTGILREPLLYLSLYLKRNRLRYFELLAAVRHEGDWEEWMTFFLEGVRETAENAVSTIEALSELFGVDQRSIEPLGRGARSALRVHAALKSRPVTSVKEASRTTGLSFPACATAMDALVGLGIAREITGRRRGRVFAYTRYLEILSDERI